MAKFFWTAAGCDAGVHSLLKRLTEGGYDIASGKGEIELKVRLADRAGVKVAKNGNVFEIEAGSIAGCGRGIGRAFAGLSGEETTPFTMLGIMLDCSRNKVMTVDYLKKYFLQLALMGQNTVMLYAEDTYQLPDEPFFGYMRGGYTLEELREADDFAASVGIELIGCIQTLGHLAQILQWPFAYQNVTDTANVLMVDEPKTYDLIRKMLEFWRDALRTRRIHIGMDETHDLGRGRFMDKHGYERNFDIFNRHLAKVNEICGEVGFANPTIWSDMFFRMANDEQDYYSGSEIPDDVKAKIPANVQLCYWDYYHDDYNFYDDYIRRHQALCKNPMMGSGVWTWAKFWNDYTQTAQTIRPCIAACRKNNLTELIFTMWGDDSAYCLYDSAMMGLALASDLSYGDENEEHTAKLFAAVTGEDYQLFRTIAKIECAGKLHDPKEIFYTATQLWDDPLLAICYRGRTKLDENFVADRSKVYAEILAAIAKSGKVAGEVEVIESLIVYLKAKLEFRSMLESAYIARDHAKLASLVQDVIPALIAKMEKFNTLYRRAWLKCAKPFGLEVIQSRNATQVIRLKECAERINELLSGEIPSIPELDASVGPAATGYVRGWYKMFASGSFIK